MSDTPRSLTALKALLPDNIVGAISPQDIRDFLVSVYPEEGHAAKCNFNAQSPGGVLSAGVQATITLSPVPLGVNGSDANHYLYISGGSGTAEAVLITGGSAVSGAASGTIIFTPANSHSGAWTIASASGGIKEADISVGATRTVHLGDSVYNAYAPIIGSDGVSFIGSSVNSARISRNFAGVGHTLSVSGTGGQVPEVAHILFYVTGVIVSAGYFHLYASGTNAFIHDLNLLDGWGCIFLDGCAQSFISAIRMSTYAVGIQIGGPTGASGPTITGLIGSTDVTAAISLYCVSGLMNLSNFNLQHATSSGNDQIIAIAPGDGQGFAEFTMTNGNLDGSRQAAIYINPGGTGLVFGAVFSNLMITGGNSPNRAAIIIAGTVPAFNLQFSNVQVRGVGTTSGVIEIIGACQKINFVHLSMGDFNVANTIGLIVGIGGAACPGFALRDSIIGYTSYGVQDSNCASPLTFSSTDHADSIITGNQLYGTGQSATAGLFGSLPSTFTRWRVGANTPISLVLPSAATTTFPLADDGQVFELTGTTAIATGVAGLREGQTGIMIWTDASPGTVSAVATIAIGFTPVRYKPYPFSFHSGKLYVGPA